MSSPILAVLYSERIVKKIPSIILALSACVAAPSYAADLIIEAPAIIESDAYDWSGFYAGLVGGYAYSDSTSTNANTGRTTVTPIHGALLGLALGANYQIDSFVLGTEGEVMWTSISGSNTCDVNTTCNGSIQWLSSVRARAGVAVDSWLLFGTLGVAAAGINASYANPATGSFSGTAFGWTAGAGVEVALADNVSVKGEYAYYAVGAQAPVGTIGTVSPYNLGANIHTVKVGVNFAF